MLVVAGAATSACQADRERPGPPRLAIFINQDSVTSPDTLTGSLRADDPDGIDSVWLSVDSAPPLGADGLLEPTFLASFRAAVRTGHVLGDRVAVRLTARDITGYVGGLDTFVVVRGP
ncbi:MAG TPA: hypothetical protein VKB63_12520 [Gemmatimonadales bacterium]|nr:hypothetical protein [Gemmatimonadales bacterium]